MNLRQSFGCQIQRRENRVFKENRSLVQTHKKRLNIFVSAQTSLPCSCTLEKIFHI